MFFLVLIQKTKQHTMMQEENQKKEEEQIAPEEIQFLNIMAMSNFGSFILIVSDQCIQALMTILAVFHNTTENDVIILI